VALIRQLKGRSPVLSLVPLYESWLASRPHRVEIGPPLTGESRAGPTPSNRQLEPSDRCVDR
jgi:hypothetical protein